MDALKSDYQKVLTDDVTKDDRISYLQEQLDIVNVQLTTLRFSKGKLKPHIASIGTNTDELSLPTLDPLYADAIPTKTFKHTAVETANLEKANNKGSQFDHKTDISKDSDDIYDKNILSRRNLVRGTKKQDKASSCHIRNDEDKGVMATEILTDRSVDVPGTPVNNKVLNKSTS